MKPVTVMRSIALLICLFTFPTAYSALPGSIDGQQVPSLAPLVEKTSPAVVSIATKGTVKTPVNPLMDDPFFRRFFGVPPGAMGGPEREVRSAGSGVIVNAKKGYILTNHHVVADANEIQVTLNDGRTLNAKVIGSDAGTDVAVIQAEKPSGLTEMKFGDSDKLRVGDFVVAIGNPFGLQHTVTHGIVSQLGRTGINRDGYEDFIQTDAAINPGNSGGALIDLNGDLIGINTAIFSQGGGNIGIGFAIPANMARSIMDQILEFGEVKRGLLGVSISDFTAETAEAFGLDETEGALVQEIVPNSAAENAGLKVGDVIVAVDGDDVTGAASLRNSIGLRRSGDQVKITVLRDNKRETYTATLGDFDSVAAVEADDIHPGLAGAVFEAYAPSQGSFNKAAVSVSSVIENSPAAMNGLRPDDLIVALNKQRVTTPAELKQAAEGQGLIILDVVRGNRRIIIQIR